MRKEVILRHEFVEFVPNELNQGIIYISTRFSTAVHLCCCGCGNKVVTPLGPTDWQVTFNGKSISLYPSIGNWSFTCRSHYWIVNSRVRWAKQWSKEKIDAARQHDRIEKDRYFGATTAANLGASESSVPTQEKAGFWKTLMKWLLSS